MRQQCLPLATVLLLVGAAWAPVAYAQVTPTTPDQLSGIPEGFLPTAKTPDFSPRGTPPGYKVNPDMHDFTASYIEGTGGGGPPGGAPGGAPPGGAPPGGAPPNVGASNQNNCYPSFFGGPYATHMLSSPGRLLVVNEFNHTARRIYIGGSHVAGGKPTFMGDSIGHWDGNALVTDTINLKEMPGVDLRERWTKLPNGSIQDVAIQYDAAGHPEGAASTSVFVWRPDISYVEDVCEDFAEAFGAGYGGNPSSK